MPWMSLQLKDMVAIFSWISSIDSGIVLILRKRKKEMFILGPSINNLSMMFSVDKLGKNNYRRLGILKTPNEWSWLIIYLILFHIKLTLNILAKSLQVDFLQISIIIAWKLIILWPKNTRYFFIKEIRGLIVFFWDIFGNNLTAIL